MNLVSYVLICVFLSVISFDRAETQISGRCPENDGRRWECKSLKECPKLLSLLQEKRPSTQEIQLLLNLTCGFDGKIPRVCCFSPPRPVQSQIYTPVTNTRAPNVSVIDVKFHPNLKFLLPKYCGFVREDNKIIMGETAGLYEFPWMALLGYKSVSKFEYRCGGTLINNRYVLTAAHCLKNPAFDLVSVRLGEYDLSKKIDCDGTCAPPVQDIGVQEIIPHPHYSTTSFKNDIGLVRLSADAVFNQATIPICLPVGREEQSNELSAEKVTVTGWGKTEHHINSSVLLKVVMPMFPRNECAERYKFQKNIDVTQFCVGTGKGKDSCSGDSGGPMQAITTRNDETVYVQYGIVSFGPGNCGNSNLPGVYTRVGFYMKWILDAMRP